MDDLTRGVSPAGLSDHHRMFVGPDFLMESPSQWPLNPAISQPEVSDPEIRESHFIGVTTRKLDSFDLLVNRPL